jgi:hypothetical protein
MQCTALEVQHLRPTRLSVSFRASQPMRPVGGGLPAERTYGFSVDLAIVRDCSQASALRSIQPSLGGALVRRNPSLCAWVGVSVGVVACPLDPHAPLAACQRRAQRLASPSGEVVGRLARPELGVEAESDGGDPACHPR